MAVETPRFLQTKAYSAKALRAILLDSPLQPGVVNAGDLMVTQRSAGGAAMFVDVAAGAGWIKGSVSARQGMYNVYNDATVTLAVPGNASGNPRIDSVIMRVYDTVDGAGAQDAGTLELIQGTATAATTLNSRNGAPGGAGGPALPASTVVLGDILVASGAASITNTVIRDRRPWARGAFVTLTRTQNAAAANDYTTTQTTANIVNDIDSVNIRKRLECSGLVPVRLTLKGSVTNMGAANSGIRFAPLVDGALPSDFAITAIEGGMYYDNALAGGQNTPVTLSWDVTVPAGSHTFSWHWWVSTNTGRILTRTTIPMQVTYEELVRPNTANNSITSG